MTDVQYKMLENLVNNKIPCNTNLNGANPQILETVLAYIRNNNLHTYSDISNRSLLKEYALGVSDNDIEIAFDQLEGGGYIEKIDAWRNATGHQNFLDYTTHYKITTLGEVLQKDEYNFRNKIKFENDEKLKREKEIFDAQLENINSQIKVNGYQYRIKASIVATAIFTGLNLIPTFLPLLKSKEQPPQSQPQQQKPLLNNQVDSSTVIHKIRVPQTISQTKS